MENIKKCNCVKDLENSILEQANKKYNDDDISDISVSIDAGLILSGNTMNVTTYTEAKIYFYKNGKKKKILTTINHSFCPFCGQKK